MLLNQQIKDEIKVAMRAHDTMRLSVVRNILAACTNELVATGKTPQDILSDDGVLKVIKRLANQRKDSIEQFINGDRPALAEKERAELVILETYLPTLMLPEEIRKIAIAKKELLGITDKSKIGQLTGAIMKELTGCAEGVVVKKIVEELLN